jgi:hypothetical protein
MSSIHFQERAILGARRSKFRRAVRAIALDSQVSMLGDPLAALIWD